MRLSGKAAAVCILLVASIFIISCGDEDEQSRDYSESVDTTAAQRAIDEANAAMLRNASRLNIAPQIDIISPAYAAEITDSALRIEWTATDNSGKKPTTAIYYRMIVPDSGNAAPPAGNDTNATPSPNIPTYTQLMAPAADPGNYTWDISQLQRGDYELMIQSTDGLLSNVAFTRFRKK